MAQRTATDGIPFGRDAAPTWRNRTTDVVRHAVMPRDDSGLGGMTHSGTAGNGATPLWAGATRLLPRLVLLGAVGLLLFAVLLFAFRAMYADRVYPTVAVGDVPVGGLTVDNAVAAVEARAGELERGTVQFSYGGQSWSPTLAELGATVDIEGSVDAAWELGRDENAVSRLGFTNALLRDDQQVPLRTTVDPVVLAGWYETVNADLDQRAVDAALVVEGTAVRIEPERIGTVVDEATATARVLGALEGLEPMAMELPTQVEQPAIYAADLEQGVARANAALDGPIVAVFEDRTWNLQPTDLVQFLTVEVVNGDSGANVEMTLDRDSLSAWLRDSFSGQVNRTPIDAQIAYRTGEGVVALEPSTDGVTLRSNTFADVVSGSFLGDQANIEVPVLRIPPEIDSNNLAALNINGLLGRGDSNYDNGQWDRDLNVEVGTQLMNGELIAPGEEFSFNQAVGEITAASGFVDAGVIEAETIGRGIGGGVCQVSTTVFRAALMAGLPITEWHQHSLRLQGYERDGWTAGFDAAIFQQGSNPEWWADFKFLNDTDGYMLVQSWTDYPSVIVEIFGNDDGRSVDFSGTQTAVPESDFENKEVVDPSKPAGYMEQTQWPAEAYAAWFTRTVTHPNGSVDQRLFESIYDGSGNVYRVSPDMEGRSPASLFGP